jgi:hypothetical protein
LNIISNLLKPSERLRIPIQRPSISSTTFIRHRKT